MTALDYRMIPQPADRPTTWMRFVRGSLAIVARWQDRRAFAKIAELTDGELADIGVSRKDLAAVTRRLSDEPTALLSSIVSDRQRRASICRAGSSSR